MCHIEQIQKAAQQESAVSTLNGWLFTDFRGRDALTTELLDIPKTRTATRRWIYIVFADKRAPIKILHAIEPNSLQHLPGEEYLYSSRIELENLLQQFSGYTFALLCDSDIPVISTVDGGFVTLLTFLGIQTVSAAPLIQRCKGLLTPAQIDSHERAATLLYKIVSATWAFISEHYTAGVPLTESDTVVFILEQFDTYGMTTDHPPVVAFGTHTGNPHYDAGTDGNTTAHPGDLIQLDIWAKERIAPDDSGTNTAEAAVYADISWVGIYGTTVPESVASKFAVLCSARDKVAKFITESVSQQKAVTGAQLDALVRDSLIAAGYGTLLKHRTGHGIDTNCHGSGTNLDSIEFPDHRKLLPGSCFSVEPGLYSPEYGMRTEINIYIDTDGMPVVSGARFAQTYPLLPSIPQQQILIIKG